MVVAVAPLSSSSTKLLRASAIDDLNFTEVELSVPVSFPADSVRLVLDGGKLVSLVTPSCVYRVECTTEVSRCELELRDGCNRSVSAMIGAVHGAVATGDTVWIASAAGLMTSSLSRSAATVRINGVGANIMAVTVHGENIIAGSAEKLWVVNSNSQRVVRWEWVTDVAQVRHRSMK